MLFIRRQYDGQAEELAVDDDLVFDRPHREQRVVIPVNGINRSVVQAVMFGKSLASDPSMLQAVFVTTELEEAERLRERWERQLPGVPLVVVESPYRALVGPVVTYLDVLERAWPPDREAPDHDRRAARVRGASLVGPAALQPGGEAPQVRRSSAATTRSSPTSRTAGASTTTPRSRSRRGQGRPAQAPGRRPGAQAVAPGPDQQRPPGGTARGDRLATRWYRDPARRRGRERPGGQAVVAGLGGS